MLGEKGKKSTGRRSAEVAPSVFRLERRTDGKAVLIASRATLIPPSGRDPRTRRSEAEPRSCARDRSRRRGKTDRKSFPHRFGGEEGLIVLVVGRARKQVARSSYPQRSAQKNQEKLIKLKEKIKSKKKYLYATQETTTRGFKRNEEEQKGSN